LQAPPRPSLFPYSTLFRSENFLVDELHLTLYPLTLGSGKRVLPDGVHTTFNLESATPYPSGVVGYGVADSRLNVVCTPSGSTRLDRKSTRLNSSHVATSYS